MIRVTGIFGEMEKNICICAFIEKIDQYGFRGFRENRNLLFVE